MELVDGRARSPITATSNHSPTVARLELVHPGLPRGPARAPERHHPPRHQAVEHPRHASTDGEPVPKVIDFGIAKATSGQQLTDKTVLHGVRAC